LSARPPELRFLGIDRPVIGVVHLAALPGAPLFGGSMKDVISRALRDAKALAAGGVDALFVENFGDRPFWKDAVPPETVAALAVAAIAVRDATRLPLGVNVLRNDAHAALAVAAATGATFVRVNVLTGAILTDQGVVEGRAAATMRTRVQIAPGVAVAADVLVKHGTPLAPVSIADSARDTAQRGLADALIVTGARTGGEASLADVRAVREAATRTPVLVGSGARADSIGAIFSEADGVIVATALERGGVPGEPVDPRRVRAFVAAARRARV
jgi:membrane complex biogenesis BtpA family protein